MLQLHTTYLTCCFLALPPHAISGWDKKQSERWVIASIFLLHDLCCTQFPINNVWIALLSPPRAREALTYTACCRAFWAFFNLYFSRRGLLNMLALSQIQPASHMYRFTCSHQGSARLTQSCFSSIWPLCSSTGAAGGLFLVQGHLSGGWGRKVFLICFCNPDFPRNTEHWNWRCGGHKSYFLL